MSETFMDEVLHGIALWTDIDDWVDRWHDGAGTAELHEFLGMSWDEYRLWAEQPSALRLLIAARERGEPVGRMLEEADEFSFAARGLSAKDAETVHLWLQKTGRLPS